MTEGYLDNSEHWTEPSFFALEAALADRDYSGCAGILVEEMGLTSEFDLLPLIKGLLDKLVDSDDEERRVHALTPEECWSLSLRAAFSEDAALVIHKQLVKAYSAEEFRSSVQEYRRRREMSGNSSKEVLEKDIESLCLREIMPTLLPQYGFNGTPSGARDYKAAAKELLGTEHMATLSEELMSTVLDDSSSLEAATRRIATAAAKACAEGRSIQSYMDDAREQAQALSDFGLSKNGVDGHQSLVSEKVADIICVQSKSVAESLFGRNSYSISFMPMLKSLSASGTWPGVLSRNAQGHVNELPTLELCVAIVTRILCVAKRLSTDGKQRMLFLGLGSGDALVEATVLLHLAATLGQDINLTDASPLVLKYGRSFEILAKATDTPDMQTRYANHTAEAFAQMTVEQQSMEDALRQASKQNMPMYVFCSWPPKGEVKDWRKKIENIGGDQLEELCFLQPPPSMVGGHEDDMRSDSFRTTQLFPKTLCRDDFLASGFDSDELGLQHSQLFVLTPRNASPPFLVEELVHRKGSYSNRLVENGTLAAVNQFRHHGLTHACGEEDLSRAIPSDFLDLLEEKLDPSEVPAEEVMALRKELKEAKMLARGDCARDLERLLSKAQDSRVGHKAKPFSYNPVME
mmetsp:Transcript_130542/g.279025  ORF Transcript_130542/g.279025 Transcript_130542/m.279025 type:complete len:634 (-) Transcript_130542:79-1980(-)